MLLCDLSIDVVNVENTKHPSNHFVFVLCVKDGASGAEVIVRRRYSVCVCVCVCVCVSVCVCVCVC